MRVLTQNLFGHHRDWPRRRAALAAAVAEADPDIVLFQEAVKTDEVDQAAEIVGPGYHLVHRKTRGWDGSGDSIASRWPVTAVRELDTSADFDGYPAGALAAAVLWPESESPLLVVSHNPNWQPGAAAARLVQAAATARFIAEFGEFGGPPIVLGGDFDAEPEEASIRHWIELGYEDLWLVCNGDRSGPTFAPSVNPLVEPEWDAYGDRRIDYLFVRDPTGYDLRAVDCARVGTEPVDGAWASDHFGVVATIERP